MARRYFQEAYPAIVLSHIHDLLSPAFNMPDEECERSEVSRYAISVEDTAQEIERLNALHSWLLNTLYEGRHIHDKSIEIHPVFRVLDVGTGSGSWILGLSKEVPSGAELVGIDISDTHLPKEHPPNVQFKIESITRLPIEWNESFDFIHQRSLIAALAKEEWAIATQELFRVLKPGGKVQLVEPNLADIIKEGPAYSVVNGLIKKMFDNRGLLSNCPIYVTQLLRQAGFVNIEERNAYIPFGRAAGEPGLQGFLTMERGVRGFGDAVVSFGFTNSLAEWNQLMDMVAEEWNGPESHSIAWHMFCAEKPL